MTRQEARILSNCNHHKEKAWFIKIYVYTTTQGTLCQSTVHLPLWYLKQNKTTLVTMALFFHSVVTLWRWLLVNWVSRLRLNPNCTSLTNKCHCFLFVCLLFDRDGQRRTKKGVESLDSNSNHWAAEAPLTAIRCGVAHKALVIELSTQTIRHAIKGRKDDKVPRCPDQFFFNKCECNKPESESDTFIYP